ncbi:MAG: hypothetical protein OXH79_04560, partial [Boseongicola sp.]|nr:hypothetical protein [Boseongicola sp.]
HRVRQANRNRHEQARRTVMASAARQAHFRTWDVGVRDFNHLPFPRQHVPVLPQAAVAKRLR